MKMFHNIRTSLAMKPTSWWLTVFVSTLTIAIFYRVLLTRFTFTDTVAYVDLVVCAVFWLMLQLISLPIVKRLFGDGMAYALAKAVVVVTNPVTVGLVLLMASLFHFSDFVGILERVLFGIPPNTFDWLGLGEMIIPISIIFLAACMLRAVYLMRKNIPWKKLLLPFVISLVGLLLVVSYQIIPTRADTTLSTYLKPTHYSIVEKEPMWSCCMIRRETSEFSATDVYYKITVSGETKYFHLSDVSDYRGFESGSQVWKAAEINKQSYESSIKPW